MKHGKNDQPLATKTAKAYLKTSLAVNSASQVELEPQCVKKRDYGKMTMLTHHDQAERKTLRCEIKAQLMQTKFPVTFLLLLVEKH